jgi:hypothetical protein
MAKGVPACGGFRPALNLEFPGKTMLRENTPLAQANSRERRLMRRFDMRLPAIVRLGRDHADRAIDASGFDPLSEFHTETQNVSARGVYLYLDRPLPEGTRCEVTLTFPPHISLTEAVRVRFTARVIRSESPLPSERVGTAAVIEDYEFLRANGPDFLRAMSEPPREPN